MSASDAPSHPAWWLQVGYALVGRELPTPALEEQRPDAPAIVEWLGSFGIDSDAVAAERARCLAAGHPWPHPLPITMDSEGGAAQRSALLALVRAEISGPPIAWVPDPRTRPQSAQDLRLIAEKPPHHG